MASFTFATFLGFLVFCILINNGTSLKCYNCTSRNSWKCASSRELTTASSIECGSAPCLKLKPLITGDQSEIVERGCYKKELCTDYSFCYSCDDIDYCNSSLRVTPSHYIFVVGLIYLYYYLRKIQGY